jgi:hypothetical protein
MERVDEEDNVERRVRPREGFGGSLPKVTLHAGSSTPKHFCCRFGSGDDDTRGSELGKPGSRAAPHLQDRSLPKSGRDITNRGADARVAVKLVPPVIFRGDRIVIHGHFAPSNSISIAPAFSLTPTQLEDSAAGAGAGAPPFVVR